MARLKTSGDTIDDIREKLNQISEDLDGELCQEMLDTGAEIIEFNWVKSIKKHKHVDTGALVNSIKTSKLSKKRVIYPRGRDHKGTSNAEKAGALSYGKHGFNGSRFIEEAEANSDAECTVAMQDVFMDYLDKKGFL